MPFRHKEERNENEMWLFQKEEYAGEGNPNWRGGVELTCDNPKCNNKFWRVPASLKKYKHFFCCSECHDEFRRKPEDKNKLKAEDMRGKKHPRWSGSKYCKKCGNELLERKERGRGFCYREGCQTLPKYNQKKNHPQWIDIEMFCKWCGEEITKRRRKDRVFCSIKCRDEWKSTHWIGENNPLWQGGHAEYPPEFSRKLKRDVRKRDSHTCQKCNKTKYGLDVHHMDTNKNNNDMNNLISLCKSCHKKVHWELWHGNKPEFLNGMKTI